MNGFLNISSSPHIRGKESTSSIMYDVAIALLPAALFGVYRFGLYSGVILLISIASAILAEYAWQTLTGQKVTISDGSALVTGLLLGMNLPPAVPLWIPVLGSAFAILFVKQFFGGIGQNFMNPALGARCFLLISFTGIMGNFAVDGMSGATPLTAAAAGEQGNVLAGFLGYTGGCIGEVCALALIIGGVYLIIRKVITWHIPVCYLVSFVIFEAIFGGHGLDPVFLGVQLFGGGLMLGAFFMATDYVSSPITTNGKILFGILLGVLTGVLRTFGATAEGVSYAIIIGNLLVPLIEKITMPTAFGYGAGALEGKKGVSLQAYRPAVTLLVITLISGLALGGVYQLTKGPIEKAEMAAQSEAFASVCPDAESFEMAENMDELIAAVTAQDGTVAEGKFGSIRYDGVFTGLDASGNVAGYVVNVTSKEGFGGEVSISTGISPDGQITGMEFLTINETAGLGMNATKPEFMNQYVGKTVESFELTKDAAQADNQIQAISGATITSTAVTNAMNAALYLIGSVAE